MSRSPNSSQKWFILAMLVIIVLTFLPARWLGWTRDVSNIFSVPLMPLRDLGTSVAGRLIPPSPTSPDPRAKMGDEQLLEELQRYERMYQAAELRVQELEEQLEQIQRIPVDELRTPVDPIVARVTARNPRDRTGLIEVNRGRRAGVTRGTVAVYGGVHLIGRVVDVGMHNSYILPAINIDSGLIDAAVIPADRPDASIPDATAVQVEPRGDGTFIADVGRAIDMTVPVAEGDIVRLADRHWRAPAQAMILGVVDSIHSSPEATLRDRLIVRPRYHAMQLDRVILLVETDRADDFESEGDGQ